MFNINHLLPAIKYKIFLYVLLAILCLTFSVSSKNAQASQSFGLFSPKIEYVDDSATANCSSDEASIELWLVDRDSENLISNSVGNWSVKLERSLSDQTEILKKDYNNTNKSEKICFDPVINGLQVIVLNSTNYKPFSSPTIFPDNTNVSALEAMRGSHFRGYVQLSPASETTPDTTSLYPNNNDAATSSVEFLVQTNRLTSLYNVSKVNKIKLYLENQLNGDLYTRQVTTNGGVGVRSIPAPSGLPDGRYFWSFHQEYDGESTTQRLTFPEWTWTFGGIPVSGLPSVKSITIDNTPPVASISDFKVVSEDSPSTVTVSFNQNIVDAFAGASNAQLYVEDLTGGYTYAVFPSTYQPYTTSSSTTFLLSSIVKDHTYRLYVVASDAMNNTATSTNFDYNVPLTLTTPSVDLYSGSGVINGVQGVTNSTAWLYGTTTDASTNYLSVTEIGSCWSTSTSIINSTSTLLIDGNCTTSTNGYSTANSSFHFYTSNLPASTTVYFRMMAKNDVGWGFSPIGSFETDVSPFDPTAGPPSLPTVEYVSPNNIEPDSLDPNLRIDSAGNMPIEEYGVCYSTDQDSINSLDPLKLNIASSTTYDASYASGWSSSCELYGNLPLTTTLPFTINNSDLIPFTGLQNGQIHYFKVFAINGVGAGVDTGSEATDSLNYRFYNYYSSPVIATSSTFNDSNNTYDKVTVTFAAVDESYDIDSLTNPTRSIDYLVNLDINNDLSYEYSPTGQIQTLKPGSDPTPSAWNTEKSVEFYNIPINTPIKVSVKLNDFTFPQTDTTNQEISVIFTLNDPNSIADSSSGTGSDSGNALDVDPEFIFSATPSLIRSGSTTTIEWDMKSVDIDCEVTGPSNFTTVAFNPSDVNGGVIDSDVRIQGTFVTSKVKSTQLFDLSCTNPIKTYSTTTRINVVGNPGEF